LASTIRECAWPAGAGAATVRPVIQQLRWGEIRQERPSAPDTMFTTTGRRLYVIGDIDGAFARGPTRMTCTATEGRRRRPLAKRLQGVWAQPVKALNGYAFVVESGGLRWPLLDAERFTQTFADVQFEYHRGALTAKRTDLVPHDLPAHFTSLTLRNDGTEPADARVTFLAYFDLRDAQFTTLADRPNLGETVTVEERSWSPARGSCPTSGLWRSGSGNPADVRVIAGADGHPVGVLEYAVRLEPGAESHWTIATVVEVESGAATALKNLDDWLPLRESC
jgi:hypothetical protein